MQENAGVKATIRIGAPSKLPVSQLPEVDEDIPYIHGHKGGILKLLGGVRPTNNMIVGHANALAHSECTLCLNDHLYCKNNALWYRPC